VSALQKLSQPHKAESYKFVFEAFGTTDEHQPGMNCTGDTIGDIYSTFCFKFKYVGDCSMLAIIYLTKC
jgi:hypothetical protein